MNPYTQLLSLLTSTVPRLLSTQDEMVEALLSVFHLGETLTTVDVDFPVYNNTVAEQLAIVQSFAKEGQINITTDYAGSDIENNSIAYHPIKGMIMAESNWYFSTKQFESNISAADANPNINVHFLHIKSGGGEAWYLDQASKTLSSLNKPIYTYFEKVGASAAYYLGVHGQVIKAMTQNDTIGSIGTMVDGLDIMAYFEKMGVKRIKELATRSDLKNKKYEDLRNGNPEQFIKEELDPLQQQFEAEIRSARPVLNTLDINDPVFRGETFSAKVAIEKKLIDGIATLPQALTEANQLGLDYSSAVNKLRAISSHL